MIKIEKLKKWASRLKMNLSALFLACKHKKTPWYAKVVAALAVGYALSPIDLIPDFIPVLGYLDDLIILPGLVALAIKLIPDDVMEECRQQASGIWQDGKPKSWKYAVPVFLFWGLILFFIIRAVCF